MKIGRKTSGGKYKRPKKRKLTGRQNQARIVKIGDRKTKLLKTRGGSKKLTSFFNNIANIITKKTPNTKTSTKQQRTKKVTIKNVIETPSNTFLARQNILVKGAIIETELGKARITNRPSQEGNVQAELLTQD
ncbi:MAG: 30S ribosomal protein S8e [archaeon]